jgi:hypothetical protein
LFTALIYPNPASNLVHIVPSLEGNYSVDLIDNSGRVLLSKSIENDICKLDINTLNAGNYFIRVTSGKNVYTEILVKY